MNDRMYRRDEEPAPVGCAVAVAAVTALLMLAGAWSVTTVIAGAILGR